MRFQQTKAKPKNLDVKSLIPNPQSLTQKNPTMPDRKVNFGVIGAGGIARRRTIPGHAQGQELPPGGRDGPGRPRGRGRGVQRSAGLSSARPTLLADPEVEAVYIASPANCHARQIELAADAGKHILCEKPLTLNLAEAREAVAVCRRRRRVPAGRLHDEVPRGARQDQAIDRRGPARQDRLSAGPVVVLVSENRGRVAAGPEERRRRRR